MKHAVHSNSLQAIITFKWSATLIWQREVALILKSLGLWDKVSGLAPPLTSLSGMCKAHLFFSFEEAWPEIPSGERASLILSLVVLIINIVIVLKIIVLTFKRAARIWAGCCQSLGWALPEFAFSMKVFSE